MITFHERPISAATSQSLRQEELTHPGLRNIADAVVKLSPSLLGPDPVLAIGFRSDQHDREVSVRCERMYRNSQTSLILSTNEAQERPDCHLSSLNDSKTQFLYARRLELSTNDRLCRLDLFGSTAVERIALAGASSPQRGLTADELWSPEIMESLKGLSLYIARPNQQRGMERYPQEFIGTFNGIMSKEGVSPALEIGSGKLFRDYGVEYVAPVVVNDAFTHGEYTSQGGRSVVGMRDFFERCVPQNTLVELTFSADGGHRDTTAASSRKLIFRNWDGDQGIFESPQGLEIYKAANNGIRSEISTVRIANHTRESGKTGDCILLPAIYDSGVITPHAKVRTFSE